MEALPANPYNLFYNHFDDLPSMIAHFLADDGHLTHDLLVSDSRE
jgi:hypothetical protein